MDLDKGDLISFPTEFTIRVIGRNTDNFESSVISLLQKHTGEIASGAVRARLSRDGNYLSVIVTFLAENKNQLDNIYQELSNDQQVLMAL